VCAVPPASETLERLVQLFVFAPKEILAVLGLYSASVLIDPALEARQGDGVVVDLAETILELLDQRVDLLAKRARKGRSQELHRVAKSLGTDAKAVERCQVARVCRLRREEIRNDLAKP